MNAPIYVDLDQIVFEGRPQDYGAYQLRKRYNRILGRASLIAILLFVSITGLPKIISWIMPVAVVEEACPVEELVEIREIELPLEEPLEEPLEVPTQPQAPMVETVAFSVPEPTPEDQLRNEAILAEIEAFDSAAVGLVNMDGENGGDYPWAVLENLPPCNNCPPSDVVVVDPPRGDDGPGVDDFILLEKEPVPVNMDDLKRVIGYPPLAKEVGIEGRVTLRVMVDKHGDYVKHVVLKDPHPILTKAVTDKIHMLKTTPGIQAGRPIKVWVTLPFSFTLLK